MSNCMSPPVGDLVSAETTDSGPRRPRGMHHITRIDIQPTLRYPTRHPTHGWQVRARRSGERLSKFFADARHDGRDGALAAAQQYRDHLLAMLPEPDATPRKAWSNTGVVGLSVRDRSESSRQKLSVHVNWITADGKRRASSYSVDKWGLRRALWNGCLRLYREREEAGYPVEEPHIMFARAQEPFAEQIAAEIAQEQKEAREAPAADFGERRSEANRERFESPEAQLAREEEALRQIESQLFG